VGHEITTATIIIATTLTRTKDKRRERAKKIT
jgi:hypothetical protein